jgi:DNA-binding response OmpR family regulator
MPVPGELRGLRILVVEDNFLLAESLQMLLREWGCEAIGPASRLARALDIARSTPLDGALLDINLAGEMSFPVATLLRERGVPFVFLTGYTQIEMPSELRDTPVLAKPVDNLELADLVARYFARKDLHPVVAASSSGVR